jgi:hypothetical protein
MAAGMTARDCDARPAHARVAADAAFAHRVTVVRTR